MTTAIKINENDGTIQHIATGGETAFAYDFPLFDEEHIKVYETDTLGVLNELILNTDYTVVGIGVQPGSGTLEIQLTAGQYPTGATSGHKFTLELNVPVERTSDFNQAGDFFAEVLNKELDLLTQQNQQFARDSGKTLKARPDSIITEFVIPDPIDGRGLVWEGTTGELRNTTSDLSSLEGNAEIVADNIANINAVANIDSDVTAVAGISGDITTVSNNISDISFAAENFNEIVQTYDTVASMKASALTVSIVVQTKGYYTAGDGGGATYLIAANQSVDGYGDHLLANNNVALIQGQNVINIKSYGAIGDGVTDDSNAIYAAIDKGQDKVIDGGNYTYRVDSIHLANVDNTKIQNATFDTSNIPDQGGSPDWVVTFSGTQGTSTTLTADGTSGDSVITVTDSSNLVADEWCWFQSAAIWETSTNVILGQYAKVKSIDSSTQITLYDDLLYDFNTADSATVAPITPKKNITIENINVIGSGANNQSMWKFEKCENVKVLGGNYDLCHYSALTFDRCVNAIADGVQVNRSRSTGLSYGITIINGCYGAKVINGFGWDMRHYVTIGANEGINLYSLIEGNNVKSTKDGGLDAHPAADLTIIKGNTIEGASTDSGNHDGIIYQGARAIISNNIISGIRRHSIFCQITPSLIPGSLVITGNQITNSGTSAGTDAAINIAADGASSTSINGVTVTGNNIEGSNEYGIYLYGLIGNLENVTVSNNSVKVTGSRGILINANPTYSIDRVSITGNIFEGGGTEGIYLLGESTNNITNVNINSNIIDGYTFGIRTVLADNVKESSNIFLNYSDPYEISTNSLNITLNSANDFPIFTVTNSTFVLEEHNNNIICNRAATITLTLPSPTIFINRTLNIKTVQAQAVNSASSNVVPVDSTTAGTSILPAVDGAWAQLRSDGTNWIIMSKG